MEECEAAVQSRFQKISTSEGLHGGVVQRWRIFASLGLAYRRVGWYNQEQALSSHVVWVAPGSILTRTRIEPEGQRSDQSDNHC